jgi:hypothetical protein
MNLDPRYKNEDCVRVYRVFTHLQTLVPSLYPHNILLQYALKSLVEWQLSEMRRIKKCS